jgi:hypothetical protein
MKKLLFILLLLLACSFAFTGCSKKNDGDGSSSGSVSKSKLVGKWLYVKSVEDGDTDTFTDGEYVQFNDDGTAYDSVDNDNATWTLSGNKLTMISNDQTSVANVDKLTSSELVLSITDEDGHRTAYFKK